MNVQVLRLPVVSNNSTPIINVTYAELVQLITASALVPGQQYLITDYQTVHTIPFTTDVNTGNVEPLLVTSSSINKLLSECYSILYPQDVIYYNVNNSQAIVPGCTKGYIYRRIDTQKSNDIGFDYRNVKFRRWQLNVTDEHADGNAVFAVFTVIKKTGTNQVYVKLSNTNGVFNDRRCWKLLEFENLSYILTSSTGMQFGYDINKCTLPASLLYQDYNLFANLTNYDNIHSNTINCQVDNFFVDIISNNNNVHFGDNFSRNNIAFGFKNNTTKNWFRQNIICNEFSNNITSNFNDNTIKYKFNDNLIGRFQRNTISLSFVGNIISDENSGFNGFDDNQINGDFLGNNIGIGFNVNTTMKYFYENRIGNFFRRNVILGLYYSNNKDSYFENNNVLVDTANELI